MDSKTDAALTSVIKGMQALTLGVELTRALVGVMRASRPELAGVTDAEIIARYQDASAKAHQAVLDDQQQLERESA